MVFSPDILIPSGPPPQAVLDQRWKWQLLLISLTALFILRLIGVDIAGALLSALLLAFGVIMTRDGMQELSKYALVYAVLCALNFFFDLLPLITELGGRVHRQTIPVTQSGSDGVQQVTYQVTIETTPFFNAKSGFVYNVQSLSMLLSPFIMALGVYLSISAHNEIQRHAPPLWADDNIFGGGGGGGPAADQGPGGPGGPAGNDRPPSGGPVSRPNRQGNSFERFQGTPHKLGSP